MSSIKKDERRVLFIASFTEFGERYSYYIIQSLLIFFLIQHFGVSQATSSELVGTVLGVIYISAIVGGYIADKLIGCYMAALLGSILMVSGNIILALSTSKNGLFLGLAFISISTGLIKSNMSSFVGKFYDESELSNGNRDFGFNIFYVGINLGNFSALFLASFLKDRYGFIAPFYSSILMTTITLLNLVIGYIILKPYLEKMKFSFKLLVKLFFVIGIYLGLVFVILKNPNIANAAIFIAVILCIFIMYMSAQKKYWKNVFIAFVFFMLSTLYWTVYFQIFISILLFIENIVEHKVLFFDTGTSQFLSIESIFVLIFGGLMGKMWLSLSNKGKYVHDIDKFNLGFFVMAITFLIFYLFTTFTAPDAKVPGNVFILGFMLLAISELSLSAIGLSLITRIAPKGYVSLYMGIWLVTLGSGGKLAGFLSKHVTITNDIAASKLSMSGGFINFVILSFIGSAICLVLRKRIINVVLVC